MRNAVLISTSQNTLLLERTAEELSLSGFQTSVLRSADMFCADFEKEKALYFIEDLHDTLTYQIKKHFFRRNVPFFSFGMLDTGKDTVCCKGSLDIGANWDMLEEIIPECKISDTIYPSDFNGLIAVETPPDTIPHKYLFHFKYPSNIAGTYISIMDKRGEKHLPVMIIPSCSTINFDQFFKKRACSCSDITELAPGTTVLTWSTERFFTLLKLGLRPVPASRCLALWAYGPRKRNLAEMILEGPLEGRFEIISNFISSSSISRFASKTS